MTTHTANALSAVGLLLMVCAAMTWLYPWLTGTRGKDDGR